LKPRIGERYGEGRASGPNHVVCDGTDENKGDIRLNHRYRADLGRNVSPS